MGTRRVIFSSRSTIVSVYYQDIGIRLLGRNLPSRLSRSHSVVRAVWGLTAAAVKSSMLCHEMSANVHKDPPEELPKELPKDPQKSFYGDHGL
jgi:hypothetical protein